MRKPSTPDPIKMIYFKESQSVNNVSFNQRTKTPKILLSNNPLNNSSKKGYSFNKKNGTMHLNNQYIKRPSTAPQKDKNNKPVFKNNISITTSQKKSSTMKRAPSPMLHSFTLNPSQKSHPEKFRVPSPMLKSSSFKMEQYKKGGY